MEKTLVLRTAQALGFSASATLIGARYPTPPPWSHHFSQKRVFSQASPSANGVCPTPPGAGLAITVQAIPAILLSPRDLLLRQWRTVHDAGIAYGPPLALVSSLSLGYVGYDAYVAGSADWTAYAFSALMTVGIVPFTKVTMDGINAALIAEGGEGVGRGVLAAREKEARGLGEREVRGLVGRWRFWNWARMMMPVVGTAVGVWTALK